MPYTGTPKTPREYVRLNLGDRDKANPIFTDGEIDAVLADIPIPTLAAAALADARATELGGRATKRIGKTQISHKDSVEHWRATADRLRKHGPGNFAGGDGTGMWTGKMMVGGVTRAEKQELATNTVDVPPSFVVGQDDHPGSHLGRFDDDDEFD